MLIRYLTLKFIDFFIPIFLIFRSISSGSGVVTRLDDAVSSEPDFSPYKIHINERMFTITVICAKARLWLLVLAHESMQYGLRDNVVRI